MQSLFKMATIDCWMIWQKIEKYVAPFFPSVRSRRNTLFYCVREDALVLVNA